MKESLTNIIILVFVVGQITACSTPRARINYNDFSKRGVALKSGNFDGEDMGKIEGEDGGAIWNNCSEKARGSVQEMIDQAEAKGANAIGNIKWHASGTSEPRCRKSWGYFLLWPFILTPLFMRTKVEGIAYKANSLGENMIPMPRNEEEKEALITALAGQ